VTALVGVLLIALSASVYVLPGSAFVLHLMAAAT
jgi:hypothetical protein